MFGLQWEVGSHRLADGQQVSVVVKLVDLRANSYRDEQHRDRSAKSYKVETGFYRQFAHRLHEARGFSLGPQNLISTDITYLLQFQAYVPQLLLEHWQSHDEGLTLVLEDLRCQSSCQLSTRLTHQALALDYSQV